MTQQRGLKRKHRFALQAGEQNKRMRYKQFWYKYIRENFREGVRSELDF